MGLAYSSTGQGEIDKSRALTSDDRRNFAGAVASAAFGSVNDQARKWLPEVVNRVAAAPPVISETDVEQVVSMTAEFRKPQSALRRGEHRSTLPVVSTATHGG